MHIFPVKTAAAESGCGETGVGKGRTMVIFRLIFYVCPAGAEGLPTVTYTVRSTSSVLRFRYYYPSRYPLYSPPWVFVGSIDYRR